MFCGSGNTLCVSCGRRTRSAQGFCELCGNSFSDATLDRQSASQEVEDELESLLTAA